MAFEDTGYSPGHPWFYVLGGKVLTPKQIRENVRASGYGGYRRDEIARADDLPEPRRSVALRSIRDKERESLSTDISRYREAVCDLHRHRREQAGEVLTCADVHQAVSLKHNHIYNAFAHLLALDELLAHQRDLFDL